MPFREIVTIPDPVLRRKARPVTDFGPALQTLVEDMIETMRQAPGVGLAAPQVGESLRLIVVEYPVDDEEEDAPKKLFVVANPEIKEISTESEMGIEGCLSLPGLQGEVERALALTFARKNPPRPTDQDQGPGLDGTHLPARNRPPGRCRLHRPGNQSLETRPG